MVLGTIVLALGLALSGRASEPWHFYVTFGALTGGGLCLIGAVPFTTVLRNWFERKRGLAFSLMFLGSGGAFACYPGIAFLIKSVDWRNTFLIEAIIVAGSILPLVVLIVRYHPRDKGLVPDGVLEARRRSPTGEKGDLRVKDRGWTSIDWTLPRAARTGRFWFLCLSTFSIWGISHHIMATHHIAFAIDLGYSKIYASSVLSLFGILYAFGAFAAAVSDRIGREPTITISAAIGISGIFVLTLMKDTSHPWMLYYYAMAYGFGHGMVTPTIASAATDIFQGPKMGATIGFIWFSFASGGSIGPWLGGWIFEFADSYLAAFILAMVLFALGCAAIWWAAPRKVRLVPGRSRLDGDGIDTVPARD
jgi:MFS family permease